MIKGPKEKIRALSVSLSQKLSYLMPDIAFYSGVPQFPQLEKKRHHTDLPLHMRLKSLICMTGLQSLQ